MLCPKCKMHSAKDAKECVCGYDFEVGATRSLAKPLASGSATYEKSGRPLSSFALAFSGELRSAFIVLYIIGGLSLLGGILLTGIPQLNRFMGGIIYVTIAVALVFIITGILVQVRSRAAFPALIVCIVLYGLDTLLQLPGLLLALNWGRLIAFGIRVLILVFLGKGIGATYQLNADKKKSAALQ